MQELKKERETSEKLRPDTVNIFKISIFLEAGRNYFMDFSVYDQGSF